MRLDDPRLVVQWQRRPPAGGTWAVILINFAGCLFAMFYVYNASRENAVISIEQSQPPSQTSNQAPAKSSPKSAPAKVVDTGPSVAKTEPAAPAAQAPPPAAPAPAPTAEKAPVPVTAPIAPGPSQSKQPVPAAQTAQSNEDLELAFNGHCRECHSFAKDDNRLGPSLYGVVGRKAGTVANFAYSDSIKGSGITWDEATLDKWITNPNALIPGNNMGTIFGGVADPAERAKIIAFLKQDTQASPPASNSPAK
jgi:cytochrome c